MSIQVYVVAAIILTPILIGMIGGIFSWRSGATHMPPAWRNPVKPVFEEERKSEESVIDEVDELLQEANSSSPLIVEYENSVPSSEMEKGIDDLLAAISEGVEEEDSYEIILQDVEEEDLSLTTFSGDTDPSWESIIDDFLQSVESGEPIALDTNNHEDVGYIGSIEDSYLEESIIPPIQGLEEMDIEIPIEQPSNVIPFGPSAPQTVQASTTKQDVQLEEQGVIDFPMDYFPMSIPMGEFRAITERYGTHIASQITTTPGNGATGTTDVMIGRLVKNVVGYVLQYGNYHIPLKGNYPVDQEGNVLLVMGQFQSPDEFHVSQSINPENYAHSNLPVFDLNDHLVAVN